VKKHTKKIIKLLLVENYKVLNQFSILYDYVVKLYESEIGKNLLADFKKCAEKLNNFKDCLERLIDNFKVECK